MPGFQNDMRALEIDLVGYDFNIGVDRLFKNEAVRFLRDKGVSSVGPKNSTVPGTASNYMATHFNNSKKYIVFADYPVLEAQHTDTMNNTTSMMFYFCRSSTKNRVVYLEFQAMKNDPEIYNGVGKITVDALDLMTKKKEVKYKKKPSRFHTLVQIEKLGLKVKEDTPAGPVEIDLTPRRVQYRDLPSVSRSVNFDIAPDIKPPPFEVDVVEVKASEIRDKFILPDYQRKKYVDYGAGIFRAIGTNMFFSVDLKTYRAKDPMDGVEKEVVIDGQQRLGEFINMYEHTKKDFTYRFAIIRFPEDVGRLVYQMVNRGKRLNLSEQIKPLNDGTVPIFRVLDKIGVRDESVGLKKLDVIKMYDYAFHKTIDGSTDRVLMLPKEITPADSVYIGGFLETGKKVVGSFNEKDVFYRQIVLRNAFRVALEKKLDPAETELLIRQVRNDGAIGRESKNRNMNDYRIVYGWMGDMAERIKKTSMKR